MYQLSQLKRMNQMCMSHHNTETLLGNQHIWALGQTNLSRQYYLRQTTIS